MHIFLHILWHRYAYSSLSSFSFDFTKYYTKFFLEELLCICFRWICYLSCYQTYVFFVKSQKHLSTWILGRNFNFRTFNCEQMKIRINTWHLITFDCLLLHLQCLLYAAELMQGSKTKLYLFQLQTFAICTFCVIGNCWKLRGLSAILIQKAFWSKESHSVAWEAGFLNTKCTI